MENTPDKMKSDLRYIFLYRTNGLDDFENNERRLSALSDHEKQEYYCTDYFNRMDVLKGEIGKDTLSSIWGIWPGSDSGLCCAVAQSYTLYANETMSVEGETRSPFDCKDRRYLSVIQIHITPEIFSRLKIDHAGGTLAVLRPLLVELKDIISEFSKNNSKTISKLYYMLSSGDFAVVTAGNDPEDSFRLSTRIRCRRAAIAGDKKRTWALFKTYTLLAVRNDCVEKPDDREACSVALRGYYSNRYWADYGKYFERDDADTWKLPLPTNPGYALYGRYDFSLKLSLADYFRYTNQIHQSRDEASDSEYEELNESVRWLLDLIRQKNISYINTRLLLNGDMVSRIAEAIQQEIESNPQKDICTAEIDLEEEREKDFADVVQERIKKVQELCDILRRDTKGIAGYRKNLTHNLHLFDKLIMQCKALNDVSDTRIYAVVIVKQIETALCSLRRSLKIYIDSDYDGRILDEIAGYVQESVRSIDIYADYIRNNNLQTLQMPNYNIETSSSVEKLLIGYSEFVNMIYNSVRDPEKMAIKKAVPIVVPALESEVVSVEVMFANGGGKDWSKEDEILKKSDPDFPDDDSRLVIVKSPTQTELSYMSSMIFSLLHEIAHQLRYEKRIERNETITAICMGRLAYKMAEAVGEMFCFDTGQRDLGMPVRGMMEQCIKAVFFSAFWNDKEMGEFSLIPYQKAPLVFFRKAVSQSCREFLNQKISGIEKDILEYIRSTARYFSYTDGIYKDILLKLGQALKNLKAENYGNSDWENKVKNLRKAFEAYFKLVQNKAGCDKSDGPVKDAPEDVAGVIKNKFSDLCKEYPSGNSARDHLEAKLYEMLCTMWEQNYDSERKSGKRDALCNWTAFGRWMGIDVKSSSNKQAFIKIFRKCVLGRTNELCGEFDNAVGRYREETADIFMCRIGGLDFTEYVSLMLINVRCDPEVENKIVDRIIHVSVGIWCSVEPNTVAKEFWQLIRSAVDKINEKTEAMFNSAVEHISSETLKEEFDHYRSSLEKFYHELLESWKEWPRAMCREKDIRNMLNIRKVYMDTHEWIQEKGAGDRACGRFEKKLKHFVKYITVLAQLFCGAQNISVVVGTQKEYFEDLKRGAEQYKPEKYLKDDSYLRKFSFKTLLPIYSKDELSENDRETYNKFCIETLLDLFYLQKFRHAKDVRKTEGEITASDEEETAL